MFDEALHAASHCAILRAPGKPIHVDSRRLPFETQVNVLRKLSNAWADRRASEGEATLREHPFDDPARARAELSVERKHGR